MKNLRANVYLIRLITIPYLNWLNLVVWSALSALHMLTNNGLELTGVADTYKQGYWNGYNIKSIDEFRSVLKQTDVILITSMYWQEICDALRNAQLDNVCYRIVSIHNQSLALIDKLEK